jgi:phosphate transport system protein
MKKLELELEKFRLRLVDMGNLAEKMVQQAAESLVDPQEATLTDAIRSAEEKLDRFQLDIDGEAIRLLTLYSPVASDLRMILSISRITSELERIGDHTVNMSESLDLIRSHQQPDLLPSILRMASVVLTMVRDALDAFVKRDLDKAQATIANDNIVDALNDQVVGELLSVETLRDLIAGTEDMAGVLAQMLIARSLERIADQATNISEEIVYMVKGHDIRHQGLPRSGHA